LFDDLKEDTWNVAAAIELFHNFTLIHDDIMDKAPLRRNQQTVHQKYGESTALLAGDVMLVVAYEYLNKVKNPYTQQIISLFNKTAKEVCEGQQLDMDYEQTAHVDFDSLPAHDQFKNIGIAGRCAADGSGAGRRGRTQPAIDL
jgi:geranylgeranyl diphosphate synthase type II